MYERLVPFPPALSQSRVKDSKCEESGFTCPKDGQPSYKKYCCQDTSSGYLLYTCCNPYFG